MEAAKIEWSEKDRRQSMKAENGFCGEEEKVSVPGCSGPKVEEVLVDQITEDIPK